MSGDLLQTKLFVPRLRPFLVPRPRLIQQLNQGLHQQCKLTLISAPAGFGKTTLVSEWVHQKDEPHRQTDPSRPGSRQTSTFIPHPSRVGWLSLDESDNDLARFLTYFIAALNGIRGIENPLGHKAMAMLQSPQPPPTETLLSALINDIAALPDCIILVLDDYHVIDSPPVDEALTFFLEHLPPQLNLVIITRIDPDLPLARLRARRQLLELRAADLRFSAAQAAEFLNRVMGLGLSADDIAALEARTEGWIAGLQLAALALQGPITLPGNGHSSDRIKSFTGSHRFVLDYLVEEVLEQQTKGVQNFLLRTAILDRLTGSLCDALNGQEDGQAILEMLEHANLFIVALDDERRWYRYHHLFSDLLRQRLQQTQAEQIPQLHLSASAWYEQQGLWADAIRHAFAADDLERAADLAELAWEPMNMSYRSVTWLGWVKALPEDLVQARPALSAGCGWASLDSGDLAAAASHFQDAERWLDLSQIARTPLDAAPDEEAFRSLATMIANGRAYLAQALGDVAGTVKYAQLASKLLHDKDYFEQGLSDILLGFAYWTNGDLETAVGAVTDAITKMKLAGKLPFIISFTSYLADILTAQGRLREAVTTYEALLDIAAAQGEIDAPETAVAHLGLGELFLEQGDMEAARRHLQTSEAFGEQPWFAPWYRHWIVAHARLMRAQGDLEGVLELLNGAERLYYRHPIPDVRPLKALFARAQLALGQLPEVWRWAGTQGLMVDDDLNYLREFEHITLARLLIAQGEQKPDDMDLQTALRLLERLLEAAEAGGRMGSVVEIQALQALAFAARGSLSLALDSLDQALKRAEPEGYFQLFVDEGPAMARLLYKALSQDIAPDSVRRLLAAYPVSEPESVTPPQSARPELNWIEPLSERELEVLHLIAQGFTNREVGERLYLTLNTVKAHTRNIYSKLGVNSRLQAVARARDLGVLSSN